MINELNSYWYQDRSHPRMHIVAAQGNANGIDSVVSALANQQYDVSPKLDQGGWFLIVANRYIPRPVTLQVTQDNKQDNGRHYSEIVCTGIGDMVENCALDVAKLLDFRFSPPTRQFICQVRLEQDLFKGIYDQFELLMPGRGVELFGRALKERQMQYHDGSWKKGEN